MTVEDMERYSDRLDELDGDSDNSWGRCRTCAHNGQCDGLPHCGGAYWVKDTEESEVE